MQREAPHDGEHCDSLARKPRRCRFVKNGGIVIAAFLQFEVDVRLRFMG